MSTFTFLVALWSSSKSLSILETKTPCDVRSPPGKSTISSNRCAYECGPPTGITISNEIKLLAKPFNALSDKKLLILYEFASTTSWKIPFCSSFSFTKEEMIGFEFTIETDPSSSDALLLLFKRSSTKFQARMDFRRRANQREIKLGTFIDLSNLSTRSPAVETPFSNQDCDWGVNNSFTQTILHPLESTSSLSDNSKNPSYIAESSDYYREMVSPIDGPTGHSNDISNPSETMMNQMTSQSILSYRLSQDREILYN